MTTILIAVLLIVLFGGGWYGYKRHGAHGLGFASGLVLLVLLVLWLLGALDALGDAALSRP